MAGQLRDDIGYFQAVKAAAIKSDAKGGLSGNDKAFAIRQLIDRAVANTEIVDVLKAAGIKSPDISILSDEFLAEIEGMKQRNLALEALKKFGYPPDLADEAVQTVLQQAELLLRDLGSGSIKSLAF